jgi:Flp pilus assembly protein TadD
MRPLLLVALLSVAGCAMPAPSPSEGAGGDAARQLRVAAAAERSGQYDVAASLYAAAAAANPGDPEIAARHAVVLMQTGNPQGALQALGEARRRFPDNVPAMQAEGRALLELGRAAEALALFDRHLRAAPADAISLNGRGVALDLLGRHADARAAYRAARAADPNHPLVAGNLALSLILAGCPDQALALLETTPRSTATQAWLAQLQGFARSLTVPTADLTPELRAAMPTAREACAT